MEFFPGLSKLGFKRTGGPRRELQTEYETNLTQSLLACSPATVVVATVVGLCSRR